MLPDGLDGKVLPVVLRVVVHLLDDRGKPSIFATDEMPDNEAEAERLRIEEEHARAGSENRWIRVGNHSVQSKHIQTISVQAPLSDVGLRDDEPFFRRDMEL